MLGAGRACGHDVETRRDRHRRRRLHRHAGAPDGQAPARRVLPRGVARARGRGLQLPARARDGDGPRARLRDRELGARVRRLPARARPRDAAADPLARGDGARALRRRLARRLAGRAVAAAGAARRRSSGRGRSGSSRSSAPSSSSSSSRRRYAEAHAAHYRDLTPSVPYILDYHVLATTLRRAADPADPERDAGRRDQGRVVEGRGVGRASTRSISAIADALEMADNHVVYKNGAKEIAHLNGCSITFMAKPDHTTGSAPRATCTRACGADGRTRSRVRARRSGGSSPAGSRCAGARGVPRAEHQLVQALRRRQLGADDARVGSRQPDVRLPRRRARLRRAGGDADPRRRRQPLPRVRGAARRRAARDRGRARAAAAFEGNAYESDVGGSRRRCARRSRSSKPGRSRGRRSATRSSTTT